MSKCTHKLVSSCGKCMCNIHVCWEVISGLSISKSSWDTSLIWSTCWQVQSNSENFALIDAHGAARAMNRGGRRAYVWPVRSGWGPCAHVCRDVVFRFRRWLLQCRRCSRAGDRMVPGPKTSNQTPPSDVFFSRSGVSLFFIKHTVPNTTYIPAMLHGTVAEVDEHTQ